MAKHTGLGKGLGALFGEEVVEKKPNIQNKRLGIESGKNKPSITTSGGDEEDKDKPLDEKDTKNIPEKVEHVIKISLIEPNREQPRKKFNQEELQELADSISKYGILQPLLVQKKNNNYEIIAGERRWRAAKLAGIKEVPVMIRDYSEQEKMEIALIENLQRTDLNPIEEAQAYQKLIDEFNLKQEEIAVRVSKNRATITNTMRLLKLDQRVQNMLVEGQITGGHARALLGLEDGAAQFEIAKKIISDQLSVRDVERLVKMLNKPEKIKPEKTEEKDLNFIYQNLEERMKTIMGTKVLINKKDKNKGRIEIEYYSAAELERIVELIESIQIN